MKYLALALVLGTGCQDDISTPFPSGLEPLEDNPVPTQQGGNRTEMLQTMSSDGDEIKIYGRGYVLVDPQTVWTATKNPDANVAVCSTNQQQITPNNDSAYEFSFLVHYVVNNILTVEWDDQWRWGTIQDGTGSGSDAAFFGMIKHQKTQGSSFITLSEGTIQVTATDDPNVTELAFVEHLESAGGGVDDVLKGVQHNYDSLVAVSHGNPIPACP
ncbi:MAG: hypothetical protein QM831_06880 [Kofleriaceae bacterium]